MDVRQRVGTIGAWVGRIRQLGAQEAAHVARELEALGYSTLWISEGMGKEVLSHATLLLAATDRIAVATGVANIWARDAISMRNGLRTIEEAFPNRLVAGLGVGHASMVEVRGQHYSRPLHRMRAYLDAMRRAPYDGPEPEMDPPILLGALGPGMLALARDECDGAHPYATTPLHTRQARVLLGSRPLLAPEVGAVLGRDPDAARASARRHLRLHLSLPNYQNNLLRLGWTASDLANGGSDDLVDALVACGGPERVAEAVQDHLAAGADHVAIQMFGDNDQPVPVAAYRAIAADVLATS